MFCTFLRDVIFSADRDTRMFAKNNTWLGCIEVGRVSIRGEIFQFKSEKDELEGGRANLIPTGR